eukprot:maker-scaffold719_size106944-snap-gene-0.25 protein:Tk04733 transcript:maker-scaffold719_size106944-snap-gene-0.25-mRNA-1 annotation:"hypothetical protein BRAFLDRAFT_85667"
MGDLATNPVAGPRLDSTVDYVDARSDVYGLLKGSRATRALDQSRCADIALQLDSPHFGEDPHLGSAFADSSASVTTTCSNVGTAHLLGSLDSATSGHESIFGQSSQNNASNVFAQVSVDGSIAGVFGTPHSSFNGNSQATTITTQHASVVTSLPSAKQQPLKSAVASSGLLATSLALSTQSPVQMVYASKSQATPNISTNSTVQTVLNAVNSSISSHQSGLIINAQPTVLGSQTPVHNLLQASTGMVQTAGGQQMLQIQLPTQLQAHHQGKLTTASMLHTGPKGGQATSPTKGQPHLLPKVSSGKQQQANKTAVVSVSGGLAATTVTGTTPLILNNGQVLTTMTQGQATTPFLLNSLGQVVGSAGQNGSPFLIQQSSGNPFIVLRPSASALQTTPTIIQTTGGQGQTILLQQSGTAGMINAQPQVKLITPQGRMQMQQIQTPSGPKLIAVPVGQTTLLPQLQATGLANGQHHFTSLSSGQIFTTGGTPTIVSTFPGTTVTSTYLTTPTSIEGLNPASISFDTSTMSLPGQTSTTMQASTISMVSTETLSTSIAASGSQLLAQIQQPLPMQGVGSNQLQLVQGPNGQYVLQQTAQPTTTYITQQALGDSSSVQAILAGTQAVALPTQVLTQALSGIHQAPNTPTAQRAIANKTPNRRSNTDPNRVPLYEDDRLPPGWHRKVSQRKSGSSAGRYEVFIIGPTGKRFRSKNELKTFFEKTGEKSLNPEDFDFSTFGTGRTSTLTPTLVTKPAPSVGGTPALQNGLANAVLPTKPSYIPSTLSSVQASSSNQPPVNVSSSSSFPSPNIVVAPLAQAQVASASTNENMPNLLQNITQPLPPKSLNPPVSGGPPPSLAYQSQISRETADADAQISQLIETLQKEPQSLNIEGDKMADFLKTFQDADTSAASSHLTPPVLEQQHPLGNGSNVPGTMSPPHLMPAKPGADPSESSKPERTSGTTGFQASFLNSLANRRVSSDEEGSGSSPKAKAAQQQAGGAIQGTVPQRIIQRVSRGEVIPAPLPATAVPVSTTGSGPSITLGGAPTQMRAVQSLPPNTRLVRGPNGQYTLQKVQTIELTQEMQHSLKIVQTKIQELEQRPQRSPMEEAELAQLQTKQQQILATGRPIIAGVQPPTPGAQGSLVPTSVATPVSMHQQIPTSTADGKATGPQMPLIGSKPVVPHLTDQQKKIVAEFKQKMAQLPQDQQGAYIAQNKVNLIKQLNFDPTQIQLLKGNSVQQRVQPPTRLLTPGAPTVAAPAPVPVPIVLAPQVAPIEAEGMPGLGLKRPASAMEGSSASSGPPPVKHKKTAWVESQVRKDQHEALNPNFKTPFKSTEDACKKLLRYHVFGELDPNPWEVEEAEAEFNDKADDLIGRYQTMMDKYHLLLIQESMRTASSSEDVMLARLWDSDERTALAKEKEDVKAGKLLPMPPLPETWANKYEELYGQRPPEAGIEPEKILDLEEALKPPKSVEEVEDPPELPPEESPEPPPNEAPNPVADMEDLDEEDSGKFVRLKVTKAQVGSWSKPKAEEQDSIEASMRKIHEASGEDEEEDSSSSTTDEEFSLKDIDTTQAVGSILSDEHDFDLAFGRYDTPTMGAEGDADSVQNAINSILDLPQGERMETPDLNNITGLLDSMEEEGDHSGQDAATEAAVNSIPRF